MIPVGAVEAQSRAYYTSLTGRDWDRAHWLTKVLTRSTVHALLKRGAS